MKALTTALTNIRRTPYQSLAAILMITITFFVAYSFSFFVYASHQILSFFQTQPQVIAFFDLGTEASQIEQVRKTLDDKSYTSEIVIISQDQALELYKQNNQDDPLLLELVSAEILPASIEVSGTTIDSLTQIKSDLESQDFIDEVVLQQDVLENLKSWTNKIQLIGLGSIAILSLTSFLIILVLSGMKVSQKRHGIYVMRILGASGWFVRSPFVMEGALYGIFGSLLGWLLMFIALLYLTPWIKEFMGEIPLLPLAPELYAIQLGGGTLVGLILAAFASSLAVSRMMKR